MNNFVKKMLANDKIRYLIAGGATTAVNLIVFYGLRLTTSISRNICNTIAIIMAIVFAYFANKLFAFKSKTNGFSETLSEAVSFFGVRIVSMIIEILSLAILCDTFRVNEYMSKLAVQFIVVVVNYVFSKLFVFGKKRRSIRDNLMNNYYMYIPFALVCLIMLVIYIVMGITPFGPNSVTTIDSIHQYVPFFSELKYKLTNEGSLFYTWNVAMGSNFVSLSAYYLSSPFNYLFIFVNKNYIAAMACFIELVKVALSALTMAYMLRKLFFVNTNVINGGMLASHKGKEDKIRLSQSIPIMGLSLCYAFSNYVIGYAWNVMWLDCIFIFPIIILGFDRLMKNNSPLLYTLSLFYCLYCNYYIGFIICIFLVLWFIIYSHRTIKGFIINGIKFGVCSLLAGGMAAFLLIPAYKGIMSTASAKTKIPGWTWYGDIFDILKQQLAGTNAISSQIFDGGANLYCGMLLVLTVFLYIFIPKVKWHKKLRMLLLLAFLVVSFNSEKLNYIWHGMHNQYGIPNRFSFLYIFLLIIIGYDVIRHLKSIKPYYVVASGMLSLLFILLCRRNSSTVIESYIIVASISWIAVYTVLLLLGSKKVIKWRIQMYILGALCAVEMCAGGAYNFIDNGYVNYEEKYYTTDSVTAANNEIERLAEESDAGFYRAELMDSTTLDEASWHNMPSISTFNSTVLGEMTSTMGRLGFYTGANEFLYNGACPFTNTIFNVRYLLERPGDLNNFDYNYVDTVDSVGIYENPYPLSVGFGVSEDVKDWERSANMPLQSQNTLARAMTGESGIMKVIVPELTASSDSCSISVNNNVVNYTHNEAGAMSILLGFTVTEQGDYYLNCRGNGITTINFYIDGNLYASDRYQIQIFHLGELEVGQYVSIEYVYNNMSQKSEVCSLYAATFDRGALQNVYSKLSTNQLDVQEFDDGYIRGNISIKDNQTVFTSVPYDKGWKVYVDGKEASYYKVCGSFIGIDMESGEHEIEMIYAPCGIYIGILISIISVTLLIIYNSCAFMRKSKNDKKYSSDLDTNDKYNIDQEKNI